VKEIWEQAILPHNLPLTCVVGLLMLYWLTCILGVVGMDTLDLDLDPDPDLDVDVDGNLPSPIAAMLRFVNVADVPLMAVLSLLAIFMWVSSMMANYYFNPEHREWIIFIIFVSSFVLSVILVKIATTPLVPAFRKMKQLEKSEPAVGGTGVVTSKEVDSKFGQVEQNRRSGAPATLNCKTSEPTPIPRGTEVSVVSYEKETGLYIVRTL
jgi:hypothetical protein